MFVLFLFKIHKDDRSEHLCTNVKIIIFNIKIQFFKFLKFAFISQLIFKLYLNYETSDIYLFFAILLIV